jgi:hypothetical protein
MEGYPAHVRAGKRVGSHVVLLLQSGRAYAPRRRRAGPWQVSGAGRGAIVRDDVAPATLEGRVSPRTGAARGRGERPRVRSTAGVIPALYWGQRVRGRRQSCRGMRCWCEIRQRESRFRSSDSSRVIRARPGRAAPDSRPLCRRAKTILDAGSGGRAQRSRLGGAGTRDRRQTVGAPLLSLRDYSDKRLSAIQLNTFIFHLRRERARLRAAPTSALVTYWRCYVSEDVRRAALHREFRRRRGSRGSRTTAPERAVHKLGPPYPPAQRRAPRHGRAGLHPSAKHRNVHDGARSRRLGQASLLSSKDCARKFGALEPFVRRPGELG